MKQFDIKNVQVEMLDVVNEFPEIFLEPSEEVLEWFQKYSYTGDITQKKEDLVNLRYGFEHGIGWKEIVRGFCRDITELVENARKDGKDIQYKSCIMKEKFGMFTPQGDFEGEDRKEYYKEYSYICNKWESKSLETCESSGNPGTLRKDGWWKVLSDEEYTHREILKEEQLKY